MNLHRARAVARNGLVEMASCEARNRIWKLSTVAASPDRVSAGQVVHEPKWDGSHPSEKLADIKSNPH